MREKKKKEKKPQGLQNHNKQDHLFSCSNNEQIEGEDFLGAKL